MKRAYLNPACGLSVQEQKKEISNLAEIDQFHIEPAGDKLSRDIFDTLWKDLKDGDTLLLHSIKALPVATIELIDLMAGLSDRNIQVQTCREGNLDGEIFKILSGFHFFVKSERSKLGIRSAKARGRKGGRKPGLSKEAQTKAKTAKKLYEGGDLTVEEIMTSLGIKSKATLYRYLRYKDVTISAYTKRS